MVVVSDTNQQRDHRHHGSRATHQEGVGFGQGVAEDGRTGKQDGRQHDYHGQQVGVTVADAKKASFYMSDSIPSSDRGLNDPAWAKRALL
jgi:hypothetical protein